MAKLNKNKPARKSLSYADAHNLAVTRYKKAARIFIWAGIINFVGLIILLAQYFSGRSEKLMFYFCFGMSEFFYNYLLRVFTSINEVWFVIITITVALALTVGSTLLGVYASQGKKKFLIIGISLYFVDWIFVFLNYFLLTSDWIGLLFNGGIHAIITFFIIVAIYQYYNVLNIEKRYVKVEQPVEVEDKQI